MIVFTVISEWIDEIFGLEKIELDLESGDLG